MATVLERKRSATESVQTADPLDHLYKITVERYNRMVETGVFNNSDPVYLWEGMLVEKMTKHSPHAYVVSNLFCLLNRRLPENWCVRPEQPIVFGAFSMPEPDLTILRGPSENFRTQHPLVSDVLLLIEVADTSLAEDRGGKRRAYAEHKIPNYWIVNLVDRKIETHAKPSGKGHKAKYGVIRDYGPNETVPIVFDGREILTIPVKDILP